MEITLLTARLVLCIVFIVAALSKLADRPGSRRALTEFGAPAVLAAPLAIFLPLAELVVATLLIPSSTAWLGALGVLSLLILFVLGIAANLVQGRKPDCHCFGQLHSAPAGWKTLLRNGMLAAVAGFVVWQGPGGVGPSGLGWLADFTGAQLVTLLGGLLVLGLLAVQWWFLMHVLRQNGRLLVRLEALESRLPAHGAHDIAYSQNGTQQLAGLPVGTAAPAFSLLGLYGEKLTLEALLARDKPVVLIFTDPNCGPCTDLLPDIGRWQQEHAEKLAIALISRGTEEENRAESSKHGLTNVLMQEDWEVAQAYQVNGTPSAVFIQANGKIGSPVVSGPEIIRTLIAQVLGPATKEIGEPAPPIKLPDLSGKTVELAHFEGEETLVLLWNPGCGYCQQMLDDLRALENSSSEGTPQILVVSAGTVEVNEMMDIKSPVVLDQEFAVGRAFGSSGTPSAVLIDAQGKVASEVAVGAEAVLALAKNGRQAQT